MKIFNLKITFFMILLTLSFLTLPFTGCSGSDLKGIINEDGSTTVQPIAQKIADSFTEKHPNVVIKINGGGSGVGITDVNAGKVDLGAISRELTSTDPELYKYLIGHDGIAIITHPSNPIQSLSKEDIVKIFSGQVTNWNQIGGRDGPIAIITRETGSGTLQSFQDLVMGSIKLSDHVISEPSNGDLRTYVSTNPGAVGFLSVGYVDKSVNMVSVNGIAPTIENCKSGRYPFVRPLYFITKSEAQGLVKEYISFAQSTTGQNIVVNEGYLRAK